MGYGGVILDDRDNVALEVGITICKLVCKGGKDFFEFLSVKVIPGTEEASTKESLFGNCL
jgi:hypothetical protein